MFIAFAMGAFAAEGVAAWRLTPAEGPLATSREALGFLILGVGVLLDFSAFAIFLLARTNPLPFRPASTVVSHGPYRWTRNPMYLGMTLSVAGVGMLLNLGWLLVAALASSIVADRWIVPREEAYLERRFGSAYLDYKSRVRRWI